MNGQTKKILILAAIITLALWLGGGTARENE